MIKRALISGLPSAGNNVLDLRSLPIPVARYYTRAIGAAGGVHVRLSPHDPRVVDIRFMGPDGLNLTREQERTIERVFFREDYRRVYLDDIGNIDYATDAAHVYSNGYLQSLDVTAIQNAAFKIVVDYAHAPSAEILPDLLTRLSVVVTPLNGTVDAARLSLAQDEQRAGRLQMARIVHVLDTVSLGVRLDAGGEKLFVADDTGTNVPDRVLSAAMAALVFRDHPGCTVAVTVDQPQVYEQLARQYGGRIHRTQVDLQALMSAATAANVVMATDGSGNFAFPGLYPGIDGLFAVGKLLELLAHQRTTLSQVIAELPPFSVAEGTVEGSWESKGRVMRCLIEQFSKMQHETIDGIKVHLGEREWVLIRPDNDTTVFHLTAEAKSLPSAQELIADYGGLVQEYTHDSRAPLDESPHGRDARNN